jgi:hypothetical protein
MGLNKWLLRGNDTMKIMNLSLVVLLSIAMLPELSAPKDRRNVEPATAGQVSKQAVSATVPTAGSPVLDRAQSNQECLAPWLEGQPTVHPSVGEQVKWHVIGSGGTQSASSNFTLSGTVSQTAVGSSISSHFGVGQGFWQNFATSCCICATSGNIDDGPDCLVTMGDLTVLIDHLFISLALLTCPEAGNVDLSTDGLITMSDLTVLIDHLFISLTPLPPCQ